MIVLGIESSCDETAAALVRDGQTILSSVVASQIPMHAAFGGVVPELASREHVENICFIIEKCLQEADMTWKDITAIAVTRGPGLMGALMVGMAYAKALAFAVKIPFVGINHLEGHLCSIFLDHPDAELPALSLVVSGGHTSLFHQKELGSYQEISRTRDDAAGEALDKLSKYLGLGYPGGPVIDRLAPQGDPHSVAFSIPKISDGSLDFSFSGIKTAALRHIKQHDISPLKRSVSENSDLVPQPILDLLASYQSSIVDQLLDRLKKALRGRDVRSIQISGGVAGNSELRRRAREFFQERGLPVYYPRSELTTDNAAMIAAAATARLQAKAADPWDLRPDPNLKVSATRSLSRNHKS
ncbi:MAG: tRNA (adenosine(37)-N6)-threonylcarbamoyltransferase complex transferase subunit TsaD [Acidobacteria bacterium]|nr:tRNA (adenosine(37)-N6)-threonylcarbamoyltransferase complex transferase subunit TsaD [Acidobacteriota bacterium]MCZ6878738.1 tRNA (adenosine(37)-N6)-threonylcarbamoyltransferase complex transferase subunit TsaD [Acidobacteriota bacterium]